jgi:hypothetical protein
MQHGERPTTIEGLMADISARIRPVVPTMPQEQFDAMVREMADLQLRYGARAEVDARRLAVALMEIGRPLLEQEASRKAVGPATNPPQAVD